MTEVSTPTHARLGILLSGRGSNFLAIARAMQDGKLTGCTIAVVLSNVADAPGLLVARQMGLPTKALPSRAMQRDEHSRAMVAELEHHRVDFVVLAGYMRVLPAEFIRKFPLRILNIHPSLLPAFPGLHAQRQALDYGAAIAGCTVHFVDEQVDHGVIILQRTVAVLDGDTEQTLSERILQEEHVAYPEAIARVLSGLYELVNRRYVRRTLPLVTSET